MVVEVIYIVTRYGADISGTGSHDLNNALLDCYGDIMRGFLDSYIAVIEKWSDPDVMYEIDEITTEEVVNMVRRRCAA